VLHIVKLCVGCDSVDELAEWQRRRLSAMRKAGAEAKLVHVTRQAPRRAGFMPAASSIYWIIGGFIRVRQRIEGLSEIRGADGIVRCGLILDPRLVPTDAYPRRPFQGWRYLSVDEAPADLEAGDQEQPEPSMPPAMRAALVELRLL